MSRCTCINGVDGSSVDIALCSLILRFVVHNYITLDIAFYSAYEAEIINDNNKYSTEGKYSYAIYIFNSSR